MLAKELGHGYDVIEDGINGRRTVWDDPENMCRNGLASLGYALYRAKPLDLVILMLGTNDLNHTDAKGYYEGLLLLARRILMADFCYPGTSRVFSEKSDLLLISPIELASHMRQYEESLKFADYTEKAAKELGISWLNASLYAKPSEIDGCHMDAESHQRLGKAIAHKVKELAESEI